MTDKFGATAMPSLFRCRSEYPHRLMGSMTWEGGSAVVVRSSLRHGRFDVSIRNHEFYFTFFQSNVDMEILCEGRSLGKFARSSRASLLVPSGTALSLLVNSHKTSVTLAITVSNSFLASSLGLANHAGVAFPSMLNRADETDWNIASQIYEECKLGVFAGTRFAESIATMLGISVMRHHNEVASAESVRSRPQLSTAALRRACNFMEARIDSRVSLAEVAAAAGRSLSHFASGFKAATGVAPSTWLRRRRMEQAKQLLLEERADLSTIAHMLGYADQSAFGAAFRRETGVTPTEWRRRRS